MNHAHRDLIVPPSHSPRCRPHPCRLRDPRGLPRTADTAAVRLLVWRESEPPKNPKSTPRHPYHPPADALDLKPPFFGRVVCSSCRGRGVGPPAIRF